MPAVKILDRGPHNPPTKTFPLVVKNKIHLHKITVTENKSKNTWQAKYNLSAIEIKQLEEYIEIYNSNNFTEHYEVNNYISGHNLWDNFTKIRSLNDHGSHAKVPGILPKYYRIVCEILEIKGGYGKPLDRSVAY